MRPNPGLNAALWLARRGMHVFPLRPGTKIPSVRADWAGCATTDVAQIHRWWGNTSCNVAVATGPSGLLVVDLDIPKPIGVAAEPTGRAVLDAIAADVGATVPTDTMTVMTPSGGEHLYFRPPRGAVMTNTAGRLGPHIDTRAVGGYVVAPGSRINARQYRLTCTSMPIEAPEWLLSALRPRPPRTFRSAVPTIRHPAYVRAAVDGEALRVAAAQVGSRNAVLFSAAARLSRFVVSGQLHAVDVASALETAASRHVGTDGFTDAEIRRTIESGLRVAHRDTVRHREPIRGARQPRTDLPRL